MPANNMRPINPGSAGIPAKPGERMGSMCVSAAKPRKGYNGVNAPVPETRWPLVRCASPDAFLLKTG